MSSTGINFSGLGSGIDTDSIIQKLLAVERQPAKQLQTQQKELLDKDTAFKTVSAQLIAFQASALSLNRLRAFDVVTAITNNADAVAVTAATGAQVGAHDIVVNTLAKTQRLGSKEFTSQSNPVGASGQIAINGKVIQIRDTDTLQNIASNINAAGAGVSASIISPNPNKFILTIGSATSGVSGRISISDVGNGNVLSSTLGILSPSGATTLKNAIGTTGASSNEFKDSATSVGTLLGITAPLAGTVQIGGQSVSIDLSTDSLSGIASKINAASISGVTATVKSTTDSTTNVTTQHLEISGTQSFVDDKNVLANLGVVQNTFDTGRELIQGTDASFTLDGIASSRSSNTITDAVSGVTINLLKEGATANITVSPDKDGIKSQIKGFVDAFNKLKDQVDNLSQFDPQTSKTSPLFGDVTTQNLMDGVISDFTSDIPGLSGAYNQVAQLGIVLDQSGHLAINDDLLQKALTDNLKDVGRVFRSDAVASNPLVRFVSATGDTKASGANGYALNITQVAEQATLKATTSQTQGLAQDETLTFGGSLFGAGTIAPFSGGKIITISKGSSLSDVVSAINGNADVSKFVVASIDNGKLKLNSRQYGSSSQFSVISSVADSGNGDTTGIGNAAVVVNGKDVQGTINGESATGAGQFLTGSQKDGSANGLQLQVTTAATGSAGTVNFTAGVAHLLQYYTDHLTNATDGVLTQESKTIQESIDAIQQQGKDLDARLKDRENNLRIQFALMEGSVSRIKSASAGIAQLAAMPLYSSSR